MLGKRSFRADVPFFCLLSLVWVLFFVCAECNHPARPVHMAIFSLGAGALSYVLLKALGYFDPIRLLPRKSSLFLLPFAVATGGYFQYMIFEMLSMQQFCGLNTLLFWTPIISLIIFGGHYFIDWHRLRAGGKRRIVLNVSDKEKRIILSDFRTLDGFEHFQFLSIGELSRAIHENALSSIDLIVTSENGDESMKTQAILVEAHVHGIAILDYRTTSAALVRRVRLSEHCLWSYVVNATQQTSVLRLYALVKPIVEPVLAFVLAVLLLPLMLLVALLVRVTSKGPALYFQTRTGYRGAPFKLVKFRSMYTDAEKDGIQFAQSNDSRITPLGAFLRKTRLDELPQLWNVIRGEMSFIGPRPERPEIYSQLQEELPMFWIRTIVKPGITGWAQVYKGYVASLAESKTKLEFDLYYIQHRSPRLDLIIIFKTLKVSLFGSERIEDAHEATELLVNPTAFIPVAEGISQNYEGSDYLNTLMSAPVLARLKQCHESKRKKNPGRQVPAVSNLACQM